MNLENFFLRKKAYQAVYVHLARLDVVNTREIAGLAVCIEKVWSGCEPPLISV